MITAARANSSPPKRLLMAVSYNTVVLLVGESFGALSITAPTEVPQLVTRRTVPSAEGCEILKGQAEGIDEINASCLCLDTCRISSTCCMWYTIPVLE